MKGVLTLFFTLTIVAGFAQAPQFDVLQRNALIDLHWDLTKKLEEFTVSTGATALIEKENSKDFQGFVQKVKAIQNSRKLTFAVIEDITEVKYAFSIAEDIYEYQSKAIKAASGNSQLIQFVTEVNFKMGKRINDLSLYIAGVIALQGDMNLMDAEQRNEVMSHIIKELRVLRGVSYGLYRSAVRADLNFKFKAVKENPKPVSDHRKRIAQEVIQEWYNN
ncbi:hypothetical protein [Persicobacter diffluens]|uniref:Uncharacterized protein n=1 Tax=Persicobacter diffluens TaxID=981 RepID=A0AAN4W3Y0_9BACT|nr:hypothetical protein PEDI_53750 [Persicobacter diffluens]